MADPGATANLDLDAIRAEFPVLSRQIEGRQVVYLDSAATSLTPRCVIEAITDYYETLSANIHRGKHALSEEASERFEQARRKVAAFVGVKPREAVFTANATVAINLVALGLKLPQGSNVVTSLQEHHANLLPWYQLEGVQVRLAGVDEEGLIDADRLFDLVDDDTRLITLGHASNASGAIQEITPILAEARARGILTLVDAAQSVPHLATDVGALGCDFLCFSGHKMLGPTGIGVLCGRHEHLDALGAPIIGGGTVRLVTPESFTLKPLPYRMEAGTPHIAGAIGLGAAVDFLSRLDREAVQAHERELSAQLVAGLADLPGTRLLGPRDPAQRLPIASLVIDSTTLAPDHVAMILSDTHKIMTRSGHHCCHPYFDSLGTSGSLRASAHLYTTGDEIQQLVAALKKVLGTLHAS